MCCKKNIISPERNLSMSDKKNKNEKVVTASQFKKYFEQIPQEQRKPGFEKLSNYKCYANGHYEK